MTRRRRTLARLGAMVGALLAAALIVLVVVADLDTAGQVAGIVGTIVSLAGLGVSVYALKQPGPQQTAGLAVSADGHRSVAAGGDISGRVSVGDSHAAAPTPRHRRTQPPPPSTPAPRGTVRAQGERSVAAGGDISGTVSAGDDTSREAGP